MSGYPGLTFEDLRIGQVITHRFGRTVTFQDNLFFSHALLNTAQLHFDKEYMSLTEFRQPLLVMTMVLGIVYGLVSEDFKNIAREVELRNFKMHSPVFEGDTLHVVTEVVELREHPERKDVGVVVMKHLAYKENFSRLVMEVEREVYIYRRDHLPRWRLKTQKLD